MGGWRLIIPLLLLLLLAEPSALAAGPPLTVMASTGRSLNGVPVLQPHPDGVAIAETINQGFGAHLLRVYQWSQTYVQRQGGPTPQPAYLLLKPGSGGFPRTGFYLGEQDLRQTDYVEVSTGPVTGRFGGVAQTFAHELVHVLMGKASAKPRGMKSTQVHSIGVRTDRATALHEGLAESIEVMFLTDPDADAATRGLAGEDEPWRQAQLRLDRYRQALGTPISPAIFARLSFRQWYPTMEDMLRYYAVKENLFARQPAIPERLLVHRNLYGAYLIESILPGTPADPPKSVGRMLQSEGVVSALFYRWANDEGIRSTYREDGFYAQFGATRQEVHPVENVYLKLFHVAYKAAPTSADQLIQAYKESFPDEEAHVERVLSTILLGQPLESPPELWLANRDFRVGAMVYDQFRQVAHMHTFDLNAASLVELLGVPGVDRQLAESILAGAPYANLEELQRVEGVSPALLDRFRSMATHAERYQRGDATHLLLSYLSWVLLFLAVAGVLGGLLYRCVRPTGWARAILNGLGAALPCLVPFWFFGLWAQAAPLLLPLVLFGLPAAAWTWWRTRQQQLGLQTLAAWAVATVPAVAILLLRL